MRVGSVCFHYCKEQSASTILVLKIKRHEEKFFRRTQNVCGAAAIRAASIGKKKKERSAAQDDLHRMLPNLASVSN
jgi:hypothetical protein